MRNMVEATGLAGVEAPEGRLRGLGIPERDTEWVVPIPAVMPDNRVQPITVTWASNRLPTFFHTTQNYLPISRRYCPKARQPKRHAPVSGTWGSASLQRTFQK